MEYIKEWLEKEKKKTRNYIHFDKKPNLKNKIKVKNKKINTQKFFECFFQKSNIEKRSFWPFIHFVKTEKKIKKENKKANKIIKENKDIKERKIFYASHFDSYIYSYYSYVLWKKYENILKNFSLENNIIAYRSIKKENGIWKNNIDFAFDSFKEILNFSDCITFTFDIEKFFDSLNWEILEQNLKFILNEKKLWEDWKNILNSITKFSYIEHKYIKEKLIKNWVIDLKLYRKLKKEFKKEKWKSLIENNLDNKWIVQWSPISWIFANIYMIDFDKKIKDFIENKKWWKYYRYSDDILIIIPWNNNELFYEISNFIESKIWNLYINIQKKKSEIFIFSNNKIKESYSYNNENEIKKDNYIKNLQYLWFSFSWDNILVRNKTLTKYYLKMRKYIKKLWYLNKGKNKKKIIWWKIKIKNLNDKFKNRKIKKDEYWNFLNYISKSFKIMNKLKINNKIKNQIKNNNKIFIKLKKNYLYMTNNLKILCLFHFENIVFVW